MEGQKETAEEKEEEEEEKKLHHITTASSVEDPDLPIMQWEDLSQRIAELEKQEHERREGSKRVTALKTGDFQVWRDVWEEEEEDFRRCRVTQRFHNHGNLQLCFINNSDSEDEDEGSSKKVSLGMGRNSSHVAGLKQEVATALRTLRDELLAEQKEKEHLASSSSVAKRKHLERWELQQCSVQQLSSLRASLQQDVHGGTNNRK
uniref:uncharacterized protein im:7136398 isoform X2 n=1 Tax=Scatophagus argus TaxID=75038 RepID=UPI001ED858E4|nr:uncharacterized protein im:7136398 isoform X2 [Scatophagus argus]